jgi:CheY-like chemotaxis protein
MPLALVIDDEAGVRRLVCRILAGANYTVLEAPDGKAGLVLLRDQRPSLVITDLVMPVKEGIETIREIRQLSPETKIVAMSGSDSSSGGGLYLRAAGKLGADAVLAKPFRPTDLLATVGRVLEMRA